MEHFYQNIGEDWFTYPNLYSEMVAKFPDGSHFVEVGSWKGRSSSYMAVEILNSGKNIKFDCLDLFSLWPMHYEDFLENTKIVKHIINPVIGRSNEIVHTYKNESLDFVFIDAGHTYEDVIEDLTNWLPKVKIGGILAGHDYSPEYPYEHSIGVNKAIEEFFGKDKIEAREVCWIYKKQIEYVK